MPQKAVKAVPEGMHTITPHLWFNGDCAAALEVYDKAFGATLIGPVNTGPEGKGIMHALLPIGDSRIMVADAWPGSWEAGPTSAATAGLFLYVDDCDAVFERAVAAGCEVIDPLMDAFWGDRMGKLKDPFGHTWAIATHILDLTPAEIHSREQEWLATLG